MFAVLLLLLILLDIPYLVFFGSHYFDVQATFGTMIAALWTYVLLALSLTWFADNDPFKAFWLGFIVYGVYDATNFATLQNYPLTFATVDTLWGATLMYLVTSIHNRIQ